MNLFLLTLLVVGLCVLGLSVGILLRKDGRFPQFDVGSNERLHERGIVCFKEEDAKLHQKVCRGSGKEACKDCNLFEKV